MNSICNGQLAVYPYYTHDKNKNYIYTVYYYNLSINNLQYANQNNIIKNNTIYDTLETT